MAPKRKSRGPAKKGREPVRKTSNASTFRFLDLSVELRNRIYKLVLTLDGNGKCSTDLLLTCKQIDEEASPTSTAILSRFAWTPPALSRLKNPSPYFILLEKRSGFNSHAVQLNGLSSCARRKA
jgi:hypothetical protein